METELKIMTIEQTQLPSLKGFGISETGPVFIWDWADTNSSC